MQPKFRLEINNNYVQIPDNIIDLEFNYCLKKQPNKVWLFKKIDENDDDNSQYVLAEQLTFLMKKAANSNWTSFQKKVFGGEMIHLTFDPILQNVARLIPGIEKPNTKLKRAGKKAAKIGKGLIAMEKKGIVGKVMNDTYLIEGATRDHIYVYDSEYFMKWKQTPTHLNFEDWMQVQNPNAIISKVCYLDNERSRERFKISFHQGCLYRNLLRFNTNREKTQHSGPGYAIFVIDSNEQFFAGSHIRGKFHHSSFLAGAAVIGAGEIETNPLGEIVTITNKSGHYQPDEMQILNTFRLLEQNNVDLIQVNFRKISEYGTLLYNAKQYYDTNGDCSFNFKYFHYQIDPIGKCTFTSMIILESNQLLKELNGNFEFIKKNNNLQDFVYREMLLSGLLIEYPLDEYLASEGKMIPHKWDGGNLIFENGILIKIEMFSVLDSYDLDFLRFLLSKKVNLWNVKVEKNEIIFNGNDYLNYLILKQQSDNLI